MGGATVTFTGPVQLDGDATVDANSLTDNNVTFTSTINGGQALTVDTSLDIIVGGVIGGTTSLTAINFDAANITLGDIGDADTLGVITGVTDINATTDITFTGTTYKTDTAATYTAGTDFNVNGGATTTLTNFQIRHSVFETFAYSVTGGPPLSEIDADNNHYIDVTSYGAATAGTNFTTGGSYDSLFYDADQGDIRPGEGSLLRSRVGNQIVPVDVQNTPRVVPGSIGALEQVP